MLDPYAFVFYTWGVRRELPMGELANYTAFKDRMLARPAVQRVVADEKRQALIGQPNGRTAMRLIRFLWLLSFAALTSVAAAQSTDKWVVGWAGSGHGPYPVGQRPGPARA